MVSSKNFLHIDTPDPGVFVKSGGKVFFRSQTESGTVLCEWSLMIVIRGHDIKKPAGTDALGIILHLQCELDHT